MRPGVAILAAAIFAISARALAAEQEPNRVAFRLDYTPRPGCIDRETFATTWLSGEFGQDVVFDDARALVQVTVKRTGRRPEAHVSAFDEKGAEHWQAVIPTTADCRELMQDVAYSIATNLGKWDLKKQPVPEWLLRWAPHAAVGTPAPSPPPRAFVAMLPPAPRLLRRPVLAQVLASGPEASVQHARLEFGASGLVVPYGVPAIGLGGGVFVTGRWGALSASAEFRGITTPTGNVRGLPFRTVILAGLADVCIQAREWLGLCGAVGAGRIGLEFNQPFALNDSAAALLMVGPRITVRVVEFARVGRFGLFGEAMVPLSQHRFRVNVAGQPTTVGETNAPFLTLGAYGSFKPM
ncbi:hypothetical protein [Polyangium aurulentum]|uniref:hypothetical protein n=1 Tax=Polyangium aurulentum TaxID=2567896 RepID=UPI0010AE0362|nr:hypothetical protein [Polyangium aurulentum]UQA57035.1 hypothetical protein E8A73_037950 [Polyangium aurulentum]